MSANLIPLFAIVFAFTTTIAIVALVLKFKSRKIEHEEIMQAIEKGQDLPSLEIRKQPNFIKDLRTGVILLAMGMGSYIFLDSGSFDMQRMAGIGAIPGLIGLGYIVMAFLAKTLNATNGKEEE